MKRLRHDLDHLTSAGLLVAAIATGVTGLISDVWDLNDFWYHTLAGYVMGALAIVHVVLNWGKLVAYARFRLSRRPSAADRPIVQPVPARPAAPVGRLGGLLTRRVVLLGAGTAAGWFVARGLRPPPSIAHGSDVGVVYHQWSKPGVIDALGTVADWGQQPPLYKTYPGAPRVALPTPSLDGGMATEATIRSRRSVRDYSDKSLTSHEMSRLLHLATGIVEDQWGQPHRTAPSSGALYPIELYPVVHAVEGIEPGVYHYAIREHALELVRPGDFRQQVMDQGLGQDYLARCGAVLFLTMIMQRMRFRYQDRSYRYGLLEAGHIGQNVYLAATSMGLGACAIGAFMDDEINTMLGIDGSEEMAVYMLAVGKR